MARNDKQTTISDSIDHLAARRAALGSAPLPPIARGGVLVEVELDQLEPNPDQPRQWIDPESDLLTRTRVHVDETAAAHAASPAAAGATEG